MDVSYKLKKLEIGCGQRPTPGYIHNDLNAFDGVDIVGNPWDIKLGDCSLEEVIALGVVEHFTYNQVDKVFNNIYRMLAPGGIFLFDVPDIPVWCKYVADHFSGKQTPFTLEHLLSTLYGWQRWPGDEHKSGWHKENLELAIQRGGFSCVSYGVEHFLSRGFKRNRMTRPEDAHIYCMATR